MPLSGSQVCRCAHISAASLYPGPIAYEMLRRPCHSIGAAGPPIPLQGRRKRGRNLEQNIDTTTTKIKIDPISSWFNKDLFEILLLSCTVKIRSGRALEALSFTTTKVEIQFTQQFTQSLEKKNKWAWFLLLTKELGLACQPSRLTNLLVIGCDKE